MCDAGHVYHNVAIRLFSGCGRNLSECCGMLAASRFALLRLDHSGTYGLHKYLTNLQAGICLFV